MGAWLVRIERDRAMAQNKQNGWQIRKEFARQQELAREENQRWWAAYRARHQRIWINVRGPREWAELLAVVGETLIDDYGFSIEAVTGCSIYLCSPKGVGVRLADHPPIHARSCRSINCYYGAYEPLGGMLPRATAEETVAEILRRVAQIEAANLALQEAK